MNDKCAKITDYQIRVLKHVDSQLCDSEISRILHGKSNGSTLNAIRALLKHRLIEKHGGCRGVFRRTATGDSLVLTHERATNLPRLFSTEGNGE